MQNIIEILKNKTTISEKHINNIIVLLEEGCTIAFIARYRKDSTGNTSDEELLVFQEIYEYALKLEKRKEEILKILKEKGELNESIAKTIEQANTKTLLEDIYEPFKGTKSTRADFALDNKQEGLAKLILCMKYSKEEIQNKAKAFLNKNIQDVDTAINCAKDIIALYYSQEIRTKEALRKNIINHALLKTKKTKTFQEDGLYKNLGAVSTKGYLLKEHRLLAILRAVNEKEISLKVDVDEQYLIEGIKKFRIPAYAKSSSLYVLEAYTDSLKRLLLPSLKREYLNALKDKASKHAINLFGKNLNELLLTPPLMKQVILGMDPGFISGCKLAIIDENGAYLAHKVIYLLSKKQEDEAKKSVLTLVQKYKITCIAIGNGTGSKETAAFVSALIKENNLSLKYAVVSEIGASVYSASKIAQEEYPSLDVTIRGAISIAQRLRDPMSALVKIDPKSLGIGQYQHDVNQNDLSKKLNDVTSSLVNKVGVDLNSSSYKLLSFISGISEKMAKNIVEYRTANKSFSHKAQLLEVKGLGKKIYEQCVGFLRIKETKNFLDNSGIHPENYALAKNLKEHYVLNEISAEVKNTLCIKFNCGIQSLNDVIMELEKPGFDIRDELEEISFCEEIKSFDELEENDLINGVVRNITDFGAFIDIGLKNDALLHISQVSNKRVSHVMDVLSINQQLKNIRILSIDKEKQKISLSLK